jgi:hypothetical protein
MPNWCVNQVDIRGDEAEVAKLVEFVKTDECAFDFRKIVPPPDTDRYKGTSSSNTFICGCATESRVIGKFENGTDTIMGTSCDAKNEVMHIWGCVLFRVPSIKTLSFFQCKFSAITDFF